MANETETTFGSLEMDERYKKLERCLKLALLKEKHSKNMHNRVEQSIPTWPSISSINADTISSSCITPSLQGSSVMTEVLASSSNLKNMLSKKKPYNINKEMIATSSVKQYNVKDNVDQCIMPPPSVNRVYHTSRKKQNIVYVSSECKKSVSTPLNSSFQSSVTNNFGFKNSKDTTSCISANTCNTYNDQEHLYSLVTPKDLPKLERVFSKWRVILNDQHQLIIKGTLECGKVARSKPVIRRYSTTCVESIFKHKYRLQGNIIDERNELPDYIRGKFYNGFPDDWENVYQIWRTFVNQGCLVTFRWPTPITDSDDDLKSEMTDLTYACGTENTRNTLTRSHETIELAGQVIQPKSCANKSPEKIEKCHNIQNYTHSRQNYGKNHTFVFDAKRDESTVTQTSNASNEQNARMNVNQSCSPKKTNTLKDFLQEDKLNIIINNLVDKNCSQKYIDKIIEMFDCLDYVMSYRSGTECDFNSVLDSCNTSKSETIPLQQIFVNKNNDTKDNNFDKRTELNSQIYSCDLGYGSIKNDTDPSQLGSNVRDSVKQDSGKCEDSDKSESETYAGVPKISIERVLQAKEASRKLPKRKVKKKTTQPDQQIHAANGQHNANVKHEFTIHTAVPMANIQKKNLLDESCVSITEEEVEASENTRTLPGAANIVRKAQRTTFGSHQLQRTDSDIHTENIVAPATHLQRNMHKSFFLKHDFIQPERTKPNVFIKEQSSCGMQEKKRLQFTDIDYTTSSDVEKDVATATNVQKTSESVRAESHADSRRNVVVVNGEDSNDFPEERESRKEFVELSKSEAAIIRSKPTIISSIPVNFNLKLTKADVHRSAKLHDSDVSIIDNEDKQRANARQTEEACKNSAPAPKTLTTTPALVGNKSPSKTTVDIKKEKRATSNIASNVKNDNVNLAGATKSKTIVTKQSKKQVHEDNPKVLTAWVPKVVHHPTSKTELGLAFRGKLLNEVGHIVHRNFTTDIVLRRLSPTLVETVNHEFYQLLGSLNDYKHVIPKELMKQCRHGCPTKIEQFCLTWKSLQHGKVEEVGGKLHDTTMDSLTVPVSSRGRRILPPLCYWTGERVTLKDNTPFYSVGNSEESSLILLNESPKKTVVIDKVTPIESPKAKANVKKSRKSTANGKRRVTQQLTFSSTDSDYEEKRKVSPRKRLRNSQSNANGDAKIRSGCTMTLRKRQKMEIPLNGVSPKDTSKFKNDAAYCSPTKKPYGHNVMYTYHQNISRDDLLSEDQISLI